MSRDIWSSAQYQRYADHRGRPFFDLLSAVRVSNPGLVVDLGCGPGTLTASLAARWPEATVVGVDSSRDMLAAAAAHADPPRLTFVEADLREWTPERPADLIVANAVLQWIPEHQPLLTRLVGLLAPGGWLAFQVPGNMSAPSHAILREVCDLPRWRDRVGHLLRPDWIAEPEEYLSDLVGLGCEADVWETTYFQVLEGEDPVLEWIKGSALRPVLAALNGPDRTALLATYRDRLRDAYPPRPWGTVFPFRRVFAVARRPTSPFRTEGALKPGE
jgi:trans-aconitate 2-methyltransferase